MGAAGGLLSDWEVSGRGVSGMAAFISGELAGKLCAEIGELLKENPPMAAMTVVKSIDL